MELPILPETSVAGVGAQGADGRQISRLLALLIAPFVPSLALALPEGAQLAAGAATVSRPDTQTLNINQTSAKAVLNWQGFSIAAGEAVRFNQPSSSAIALNRVVGSEASRIFGSLSANGQVFLINTAGVLFAPGASVDVGGLVASSLNIKDADFLAGRYVFERDGSAGRVVNEGRIVAPGGYVALLGPQVTNQGLIAARLGTAALAAGDAVSLDLVGDGLINLKVSRAALDASVANGGRIEADGGRVILAAESANALVQEVINVAGVIRANSLQSHNGVISLRGGSRGVVRVAGQLEARGAAAETTGGSITVLGDKLALVDSARLDASGVAGGGRVLVGGNWQGQGPEPNASATYVGRDAVIAVDALAQGNGGTAVVWADGVTRFFGTIGARGGARGGDGGKVEVSGKQHLAFAGQVDALAPQGRIGSLLLDPTNITVDVGAANALTDVDQFGDPGATVSIGVDNVNGAGANVTLQAGNDITLNTSIAMTGAGVGITLQAGNNIDLNTQSISTNAGNITLRANDPAGTPTGVGSILRGASGGNLTTTATTANAASGAVDVRVLDGSGTITLGDIATTGKDRSDAAGHAGNSATVIANDGAVVVNSITTQGGNSTQAGSAGGAAGNISVALASPSAARSISVGSIVAKGGLGAFDNNSNGGSGGAGGTVTLDTNAGSGGSIAVGVIESFGGAGQNGGASGNRNGGNGGAGGNVNLDASGASGTVTVGAITLSGGAGGSGTGAGASGTNGSAGNLQIAVQAISDSTITGIIGATVGTATVTKTGSGKLILGGDNSYTGLTTVSGGTLQANHANALGTTAAGTVVADTATLIINAVALGNESVTLQGSSTLNSTGTASLSGAVSLGTSSTLGTTDAGTFTINGAIGDGSGSGFAKAGAGKLALGGNNSYTGSIAVNAGTLQADHANALGTTAAGTTVANGAALIINGVAIGAEAVTLQGTSALRSTGTASLAGGLALGTASTLGNTDAGSFTLSGSVADGTGSALTKDGVGTLLLSGNNSYSGLTTIGAGTLAAAHANALGSTAAGTTVANGAALIINGVAIGAEAVTLQGTSALRSTGTASLAGGLALGTASTLGNTDAGSFTLSGSVADGTGSALTKDGAGTLLLTGSNAYTGTTTVGAGTLQGDTTSLPGAIVNNAALLFNQGVDATFTAAISGSGSVAKLGAGNLSVSGNNSYAGITTVSAGILTAAHANALGSTAAGTTVANGAALIINGVAIGAEAVTLQGTSALRSTGTASLAGGLALGTASTLGNTDAGSFTLSGSVADGTGSALTKDGVGTLLLSGNNSYSGLTTIGAGTLAAAHANALGSTAAGTTVANGAALIINGVAIGAEAVTLQGTSALRSTGTASLAGGLALGTASTLGNTDAGSFTLSGSVADGTGSALTKDGVGTLLLSGNNSYSGLTTIGAGTLAAAHANALGSTAAGTTVANGAALIINGVAIGAEAVTLQGTSALRSTGTASLAGGLALGTASTLGNTDAGSFTLSGSVADGTGSALTKDGAGTLLLTGSNAYTGTTTVGAGTLQGDTTSLPGAIVNNAALLFNQGVDATFTAAISGSGSVAKLGAGNLSVSGNNSYAGITTVSAGILTAAHANALGSTAAGTTVANGAALIINGVAIGAEAVTLQGTSALRSTGTASLAGGLALGTASTLGNTDAGSFTLSGSVADGTGSALTKDGVGTLLLSGNNSYSGLTTIGAGTLAAAHANALGSTAAGTTVANGAALIINGVAIGAEAVTLQGTSALRSTGTASLAGGLALGTASTLGNTDAGSFTLSGSVADGTGSALTKDGVGTLLLSGNNSYSGLTTIGAGTLAAAHANALGSTAAGTTVANGAALIINGVAIGAEAVTLQGTSALRSTGTASLAGGLALGTASTLGNTDAGSFTLSGSVADGTGSALTKDGVGTLLLSGNNSYSGLTTIGAGTLAAAHANALGSTAAGTTVANGAALIINGVAIGAEAVTLQGTSALRSTGTASLAGGLALGTASTLGNTDAGSFTLSGSVADGTGSALTKDGVGTLLLSGNNSYSGLTTIGAGTLAAAHANALGSTAAGTTVANGAALIINGVAIGAEAVTLAGNGIAAGGALSASGNASLAGNTSLAADASVGGSGNLTLSGAVLGAGRVLTISKSAGTLLFAGDVTLAGLTAAAGAYDLSLTGAATSIGGAASFGHSGVLTLGDATTDGINVAGALTATAPSLVHLIGGASGGSLTFGTVALDGATTLSSPGGPVSFSGSVNGAQQLVVTAGTTLSFGATVGGTTPLTSLTTNSGGSTIFGFVGSTAAPSVRSSGAQTYSGAVQLNQNTVLESTAGGAITLSSTVDGNTPSAQSLELNTAGTTTLRGRIGATQPLATITTDAVAAAPGSRGGVLIFDIAGASYPTPFTASIRSAGNQSYNDPNGRLDQTTVLEITNAGAVSLPPTLNLNGKGLAVRLPAAVCDQVQGSFGGGTFGCLTLAGDSSFGAGNANVTFGGAVNALSAGVQSLSVVTGGITRFSADVGGLARLASLSSDAPGSSVVDSGISLHANAIDIADPLSASSLSLDAGSGNLAVQNAGNAISGTLSLIGGLTQVRSAGNLTVSLATGATTLTAGGLLRPSGTASGLSTTAGATELGALNVAGDLLVSASGAVTQSAAINVGGGTHIAAAGQTVSLTNAANRLHGAAGGFGVTAARAVDATNGAALVIDGMVASESARLKAPQSINTLAAKVLDSPELTVSVSDKVGPIGTPAKPVPLGATVKTVIIDPSVEAYFSGFEPRPTFKSEDTKVLVVFNNNLSTVDLLASQKSSAQQSASAALARDLRKIFGTDSIADLIEFGFVGDLSEPIAYPHNLEGGVKMPDCADGKSGQECN